MADPISIIGLSIAVVQILTPIGVALAKAIQDGKNVHETLYDLQSDLKSVTELSESIHRLFSVASFKKAVHEIQDETNVTLETSLKRALEGCWKEAQRLSEILMRLGLQIRSNIATQALLYWRLDRRIDDIDRMKRNFQDHKISIQLAFQILTTCKQMQIAERDARHASGLETQLDALQHAIEHISRQIHSRQMAAPGDEEQTQLLDGMKDMQTTSVNLQRRATSRLESLTALAENAAHKPYVSQTVAPTRSKKRRAHNDSDYDVRPMVSDVSVSAKDAIEISVDHMPMESSQPPIALGREIHQPANEGEKLPMSGSMDAEDDAIPLVLFISAHEFENKVAALLASVTLQRSASGRPLPEELIIRVSGLLLAVGKHSWSERPRTYLVLRLIHEVRAMDDMVLNGYKDIDFPYSESTVPERIKKLGVQREFLQTQRLVLSEKSADLVQGGRHRHLDKSADTIFDSLGSIGTGGFSIVDRVQLRSRLTLHEYARKRIVRNVAFAKDRKALIFFENEIHNLKRLSHDHLVKFVGSYTDRKYIGIIMQPVADTDLHCYLLREEWTPDEIVTLRSWIGCLCSALAYLHTNKCRHKDLKPHNILIKGENVLLADFGNAFDWTELDNEITTGPPEAYTKLYVAPEVGLQKPRDKSSDVWSLGCVFLEMATTLAGKSLRSKSEFFSSANPASPAYWRNHEAISRWITLIKDGREAWETLLLGLISKMTALDPRERPTAKDLVENVSSTPREGVAYRRSCCFDDLDSDDSSWHSTIPEEIFETTNTMSDMTTTVSSTDMPVSPFRDIGPSLGTPLELTSDSAASEISPAHNIGLSPATPLGLGNDNAGTEDSPPPGPSLSTPLEPAIDNATSEIFPPQNIESWQNPIVAIHSSEAQSMTTSEAPIATPLKVARDNATSEIPTTRTDEETTASNRSLNQTTADSETFPMSKNSQEFEEHHRPTSRTSDTSPRLDISYMPGSGLFSEEFGDFFDRFQDGQTEPSREQTAPPVIESPVSETPVLAEIATVHPFLPTTEIEKAFFESHHRLESLLIKLKKSNPRWPLQLLNLIQDSPRDIKGFNLLLVASKFNNTALAKDVVGMVLRNKPERVNDVTVFGNSALHYAALNGRAKMIRYLIEQGAAPAIQNARGQTPLQMALRESHDDAAINLLPHLTSDHINMSDDRGRCPIHTACILGSTKLVRLLLDAGADIAKEDHWGETPIQICSQGDRSDVKKLLQTHARQDTSQKSPIVTFGEFIGRFKDQSIQDCLCEACLLRKVMQASLSRNPAIYLDCWCLNHVRIFAQDTLSRSKVLYTTLLACACIECSNNRRSNTQRPPCGTPISSDYLPYNESLKSGMRIQTPFTDPPTLPDKRQFDNKPLPSYPGHQYYDNLIEERLKRSASSLSEYDIMTVLLNTFANAGFNGTKSYRKQPDSALKWVIDQVRSNDLTHFHVGRAVEILLDCGANVDIVSESWTILGAAVVNQDLPLIQLLLCKKADIDLDPRETARSLPALGIAIFFGRPLAARMLLQTGAKINVSIGNNHSTLLHEAASRHDKQGWCIPFLLAHGANPELRDVDGYTALHLAVARKHLHAVVALLEAGAEPNVTNKALTTPLGTALEAKDIAIVSTLLLHGANVHVTCNKHANALLLAIGKGNSDSVQLLLEEYGADENIHRTDSGTGVLHALPLSKVHHTEHVVDMLLDLGLDVNAKNELSMTPLHYAASKGKLLVVRKLLARGASMHVRTWDGKTPFDFAKQYGHRDVAKLLRGGEKKSWWRR